MELNTVNGSEALAFLGLDGGELMTRILDLGLLDKPRNNNPECKKV